MNGFALQTIRVYFYKGPATTAIHKLSHYATCKITDSIYSHCEVVIPADTAWLSWSSSIRDKGVRSKKIDYDDKWDYIEIKVEPWQVRLISNYFIERKGKKYDYAGAARFAFPFLPKLSNQFFCSEICAEALSEACVIELQEPSSEYHPGKLYELINKQLNNRVEHGS